MVLSITVRLREGRYDAADEATRVEWPPHPARLFCALVASAEHDAEVDARAYTADDVALRWLEGAGPPSVMAVPPSLVETSIRSGYVVTNATESRSGSTNWPGRTNRASTRVGALPTDEHVAYIWPDAQADDGILWRLAKLARRVPYIGRSTSSAEVVISDEMVAARESWVTYRPTRLGTPGAISLRVPYPGYTDQLRAAYAEGQRSWEVARSIEYTFGADSTQPVPEVATGPYRELLIWPGQRGGVPVRGDRLLAVTDILRRAVIDRIADPVPPQASGHGADDLPHLAYLPLLDVGHRHADGRLLGVAVALPEMARHDRLAVLRGLLGPDGEDPIRVLRSGPDGILRLGDPAEPPPTWGLRSDRWTGQPEGTRRWVSVSPVMLDRYPGRRDPSGMLADGFVKAGYPRPESVTVLEAPLVQGAVRVPRRGSIPANRPIRPFVHCRVEFSTPVRGPVLAGALRYLGCGMFVPEVSRGNR
ncbi:type I-U CRISPR-associated protein Csb2 [Micromonospora sp. CPCC 206060]|uniref:type I-G CRISPR-associated protein Csb2 n=1 Tax=Micromonospora sp. CPCC 206060 TaxID=3122406 RepID=UPI002FEEF41B